MFKKLKWGAVALASALLAGSLGLAAPALADDVPKASPAEAKLTKVIDASDTIDTTNDTYTFTFAGSGEVTKGTGDSLASGGVTQDSVTLKEKDVVPAISDLTLHGVKMSDAPSLNGGNFKQTVVQASMAYILGLKDANGNSYTCDYAVGTRTEVVFPHAGVYTYRVTEAKTSIASGSNVIASRASYLMRVNVKNDVTNTETGETTPVVDTVTVEKERNDDGNSTGGSGSGSEGANKVDPTKPVADYDKRTDGGKITDTGVTEEESKINNGESVGDARGRDVNGFTFANEYTKGGNFIVEKRVTGASADKSASKKFPITLTITDAAAPDGSGYVYEITNGGEDTTGNDYRSFAVGELGGGLKMVDASNAQTVNNVKLAQFTNHVATISANLAHGQQIKVIGLYGTERYDKDSQGNDTTELENYKNLHVRAFLTEGLNAGSFYKVEEEGTPHYLASAFIFNKGSVNDFTDEEKTLYDSINNIKASDTNRGDFQAAEGAKLTAENTDTSDTTKDTISGTEGGLVIVVNAFDDSDVTPTGILINNLPYVLMVGIPVAVGVAMFANKRRQAELD